MEEGETVAFDEAVIGRLHHFEETNELKDTTTFVGTLDSCGCCCGVSFETKGLKTT